MYLHRFAVFPKLCMIYLESFFVNNIHLKFQIFHHQLQLLHNHTYNTNCIQCVLYCCCVDDRDIIFEKCT